MFYFKPIWTPRNLPNSTFFFSPLLPPLSVPSPLSPFLSSFSPFSLLLKNNQKLTYGHCWDAWWRQLMTRISVDMRDTGRRTSKANVSVPGEASTFSVSQIEDCTLGTWVSRRRGPLKARAIRSVPKQTWRGSAPCHQVPAQCSTLPTCCAPRWSHPSCCCPRCPAAATGTRRCRSHWLGWVSTCDFSESSTRQFSLRCEFGRKSLWDCWCVTGAVSTTAAPQFHSGLWIYHRCPGGFPQHRLDCCWSPAPPGLLSICLELGSHSRGSGSDLTCWNCCDSRHVCARWSWWGFGRCCGKLCTRKSGHTLCSTAFAAVNTENRFNDKKKRKNLLHSLHLFPIRRRAGPLRSRLSMWRLADASSLNLNSADDDYFRHSLTQHCCWTDDFFPLICSYPYKFIVYSFDLDQICN